ncbi:MAG TPA: 50S ribosomal protein L15 [Candidatus Paceibacterota bacterium]|nr:50S ribosomal protein L15 [Candidatus Paceibacterota bacterium]
MASLNSLKRTGKRPYRRVGRGQSSTRGKTSGRGTKGQNARSGRKKRPELRDIIKKIPKRRGYGKNRGRTHVPHPEPVVISLDRLEKLFESGADVSRTTLIEKGVLSMRAKNPVKVVGTGSLSKKLSLSGIGASTSAKAAIEKAGGSIK